MLLDFSQHTQPEKFAKAENSFDETVLHFLERWHSQDSFTIHTSGSTGIPKPIVHSKRAMHQSALLTGNYFNFKKGENILLCLPANRIGGIMLIVRAIIWQLKLYTLPPKLKLDIESLPAMDFASLLPVQAIENFAELHHIKNILLGGAALPLHLEKKIQQHKSNFYLSYGMTETLSHIALRKINGKNATLHFTTLPGVSIGIDTDSRLFISASKLGIRKLKTNDIIKILTPTTFEFVGRYDNVINSGGLKINAEAIEKQLAPYVSQSFYIKGIPDAKLGEKVALFIESKQWNAQNLQELEQQIQTIHPKQARPKTIIFQENFAYTPTGKIRK